MRSWGKCKSSRLELADLARAGALPPERIIRAGKIERSRQRRLVPPDAAAGIGEHAERIMGGRKGIIGEFALARQHFGTRIQKRAGSTVMRERGRLSGTRVPSGAI